MTKLLKILGNTILILIEISLTLVIAFAFLIRTSHFQTYLAKKGADYLSEMLDTEVSIGIVDITFLDRIYFDKFYVEDQHNDTLAYIDEFYVNFNLSGAIYLNFHLDEVGIKEARFALKRYKDQEDLNLQFVIDAFAKDTVASETPDFNIHIYDVNIENSRFTYEDENKEKISFGVDYSNLDGKDINLKARNVWIKPGSYEAEIQKIALRERSGFEIRRLSTQAFFNDNGLNLQKTQIKTAASNLVLDSFKLKTKNLSDFSDFIHKVELESAFDTSQVALKEVSYFAPQLKGMEDVVEIKGHTQKAIHEMEMNNLYLGYGRGTAIKGDFSLLDFDHLSRANIDQQFDYLSVNIKDVEQFKLPESAGRKHVKWPEALSALTHIKGSNIKIKGDVSDVNISLNQLSTNVGTFAFKDEFRVLSDTSFTTMTIIPKNTSSDQIQVSHLDLEKVIKSDHYGKVNGHIGMKKATFKNGNFSAIGLSGVLEQTRLYSYAYDYIILDDLAYEMNNRGAITQNEFKGNIYVRDDNFDLTFKGFASIGEALDIKAQIELECAHLSALNPNLKNRGELNTSIQVDLTGRDFNDFRGNLLIDSLYYQEGMESFSTTDFYGYVNRNPLNDSISIKSQIVDVEVHGRIDYSTVTQNITYQLAQIFPAIDPDSEMDINDDLTQFKYDIKFKNVNDLLTVFYPSLQIADQAEVDGYYNGERDNLGLNINADYVTYDSIRINNINALQEVSNEELLALIDIKNITIRDSLAFKKIHFTGLAAEGELDSQLLFEGAEGSKSNIEWYTYLNRKDGFEIDIFPSYVNVNGHEWNLYNTAEISYVDSCFNIKGLKLEHEEQYISASGVLSNSIKDRLYLDIMDLNLKEFGNILGPDVEFSGIANVAGYITTPVSNLQFFGEAIIEEMHINKTEVGNVSFGANFKAREDEIHLFGDILYHTEKTFAFEGDYLLEKDEEIGNLDLNMKFQSTDIGVVNEFLDPEVISKLEGKLDGSLNLTGTFAAPKLEGKVDFHDGMINVAMLGADMYFSGEIESVVDGVYINQMPIKDEEGNTGFITGSLFHNNFKDFNFEIIVNLEEHPTKRMYNNRSKAMPVDRFLVLNTNYDVNSPFYGKGYATGIANISGYTDNLSIIVNAKTQRGTRIVLPMYGPTTIEESGFISFKNAEKLDGAEEKKVDLTGIDLQLNFDVTEDAEVKLIFDEKIGDEISARGGGNLSLSVDQFNDLAMDGTYTVASGVYNFALGPYKQNFNIKPGGSVQWTGDPYEAILDIDAYYKTTANLSVVMPEVVENQTSGNEEIYSYLKIKGNMLSPEISFDLEAPNATEYGRAIMARIRSDQDELNKQFFSILISKSFMPIAGAGGSSSGSGGAFLDLASTQINALLNKVSEGYQMNVNLESDDYSGDFSGEFGVSKGFLDDRLLVSGSFGVGTQRTIDASQSSMSSQNTLIGDVRVEYLLNEPGTFRMNVFNESNNHTVLQNEGRGQFTQGVGVSYKEDFHTLEDFKLFQFFANIFRKRENWVSLNESKDKKVPITEEQKKKYGIKNEE